MLHLLRYAMPVELCTRDVNPMKDVDFSNLVRLVIQKGYDVNKKNQYGLTPLWNALVATCMQSTLHPAIRYEN